MAAGAVPPLVRAPSQGAHLAATAGPRPSAAADTAAPPASGSTAGRAERPGREERLPVSVIVVVYGSAAHLRRCLESLEEASPGPAEVIIVDNASPEDVAAEIRDFPENLDGWSRLALIHASSGQANEFRETILAMTRQVPTPAGFEAAARVCQTVGDAAGARLWRQRKAGRPAGPR